jgi:hypothetical protein
VLLNNTKYNDIIKPAILMASIASNEAEWATSPSLVPLHIFGLTEPMGGPVVSSGFAQLALSNFFCDLPGLGALCIYFERMVDGIGFQYINKTQ